MSELSFFSRTSISVSKLTFCSFESSRKSMSFFSGTFFTIAAMIMGYHCLNPVHFTPRKASVNFTDRPYSSGYSTFLYASADFFNSLVNSRGEYCSPSICFFISHYFFLCCAYCTKHPIRSENSIFICYSI